MRAIAPLSIALAALLLTAPLTAQVPTPTEVIGFELGADYHLADYGQIQSYFRALAEASDRVVLEEIGTTTLGRPMLLAFISSPENLARRQRIKEINARLARAEGLTPDEAKQLAREGLATVWIDGGLHATEVAHSQHTPELAYWLATGEDDEARRIRDNVMVLVMPNMNPDGLDIVTSWYRRNLGTPFETADIPGLYHHYVGHDNNRDWYRLTQVESQAAARIFYHEWFPQIIYNHHQTGPYPGRIWVPPPVDPLTPNVDPMMAASFSHIGQYILKRFMKEGKPGVTTGIGYRVAWGGGFMHAAPQLHNMLGMFTETALYRYATPHCYSDDEIGETFTRNITMPTRIPSMYYPVPWEGGCWHMRDAMDYMMTASKAVLDLASKMREDFLYDIYHMGRRQIARGMAAEGGPFAWVIDPADQHDPGSTLDLLRVFRTAGVEVHRADRDFQAGDDSYAAGSYIIGPQAFRPFVVDLMERRDYPDRFDYPGGPPEAPYDFTGYNLPDQMGVTVHRVHEMFQIPGSPVDEITVDAGEVRGDGNAGYLLSATNNHSYRAVNRLLASGARVSRLNAAEEIGGASWEPGTFVIQDADRGGLQTLARDMGLEFVGVDRAPAAGAQEVHAPRVGLYKSWVTTMPEGWTRWVLDQYEFQVDTLHDADLTPEKLRDYDVVILPDQGAQGILNGHPSLTMPEEFTGGVGAAGSAALDQFVKDGGWLLGVHQSVEFASSALGLPVRNRVDGVDPRNFFIPGSLIRVDVDTADPMAYGMNESAGALFWRHSMVMRILPAAQEAASSDGEQRLERDISVFASFPEENILLDGWAIGEDRYLAGAPAGVRIPHGEGNVVLLGFRPDTRGQPNSTFKLLFNPLLQSTVRKGRPASQD